MKETINAIQTFSAEIKLIGINPFVYVPQGILNQLFKQSRKNKGYIPIYGTINDKPYRQTLVKYSGEWRLYINAKMLKDSPKRIGETIVVFVAFDNSDRNLKPHPRLEDALNKNKEAKNKFNQLNPSLQKEIVRYFLSLKTEKGIESNLKRVINFLLGNGTFVGRQKP